MLLKKEFLFSAVLALLVFVGQASAGPNANATVSLDLIADGGAGNQKDDGVISGTVSGQGTKIAVEVFAKGVTTSLVGVRIDFDFDASVLTYVKAENSAFAFIIPEVAGANLAAAAPVTLPASGFLARAEFTTVADVTGQEFSIGIKFVTFADSPTSSDVITTTDVITFNAAPSPDFDGDGVVGIPDFLMFVDVFGSSRGDGKYEAKYDLDGNGVIEIPDFLIFVNNFGKTVPSSGDGGDEQIVDIPDANLRAIIADSLGKASSATITQADMLPLTTLLAPNANISDLTGLEYATNLQTLDLGSVWWRPSNEYVNSNAISDFSALLSLTSLTSLDLSNNNISDISVLSGLTSLTSLDLSNNNISDFSPLSSLTSLTRLGLSGNDISNLSAFVSAISGLTSLTSLVLYNTSISDISALSDLTSLIGLNLGGNNISEISVLSGLTSLTWLGLWDNSISDISALSSLTNLTSLYLSNNNISDISVLSSLTSLTDLHLSNNNISDISALSSLTSLIGLRLDSNNISDISVLSDLTSLYWPWLRNNSISDLAPLVANTGLGSGDGVDVRNNPLSNTSINTHIPALQGRGVTVRFGSSKPAVGEKTRRMSSEVMKRFGRAEWKKDGDSFGQ